ncbi:MAG TPA: Holliday junction resolvase RuvX [Steroidobacteraceae bacterium]|jgi:putative Holliday junction resolvase|nr:Holliday junction resolvase RuvX [Steroidobacteraceae bacterium]
MNEIRCVIAFDFGLRRIGIAAGDTLTRSAAPRPAVAVGTRGPDWTAIAAVVQALNPALLVVGAPYNVDDSPGRLTGAARAFAAELGRRFGLPVERVDERFSSIEAGAELKSQRVRGQRRRIRREHIDSAAAAVILERWLAGEVEKNE